MRYYKTYKDNGERIEISREEARNNLEVSYIKVEELLETPAVYPLAFSYIEVVKE